MFRFRCCNRMLDQLFSYWTFDEDALLPTLCCQRYNEARTEHRHSSRSSSRQDSLLLPRLFFSSLLNTSSSAGGGGYEGDDLRSAVSRTAELDLDVLRAVHATKIVVVASENTCAHRFLPGS
jgi:hypothetical protein